MPLTPPSAIPPIHRIAVWDSSNPIKFNMSQVATFIRCCSMLFAHVTPLHVLCCQALVCVHHAAVLRHHLAVALEQPLGGQQALNAHRAAGMDAARGDANLCAQAKAEAVTEACGGVVHDAGAVHPLEEVMCTSRVLRDDRLSVAAAVPVDVVNCLLHAVHHLHGAGQCAVLVTGGGRRGQTLEQLSRHPVACVHLHARLLQRPHDLLQALALHPAAVHQHFLHGIAGGRVVHLGVNNHLERLVQVCGLIHVDVADAVCVAQHRDLGVALDVAHQGVAAPGDDEVDDVIQGQQVVDLLAGLDQVDQIRAQGANRLHNDPVQRCVGVCRLLAAFEQQPVTGAQGKGRDLGQGVRSRLKDNEQHANGGGHLVQDQAICHLSARQQPADGLLLGGNGPDAVSQDLDLGGLEHQALQQGVGDAALSLLDVLGVLCQDEVLVGRQGVCHPVQHGHTLRGGQGLQGA
mmetsp:Transcript_37522/g.83522  ORF Transcript_37522/g.83522 Transcript_37522/m.83522 type:complete len:461 (-) Transcript_37522:665-2047(-)